MSSDDSKDALEDLFGRLRFHMKLLMRLIPTMEHVLENSNLSRPPGDRRKLLQKVLDERPSGLAKYNDVDRNLTDEKSPRQEQTAASPLYSGTNQKHEDETASELVVLPASTEILGTYTKQELGLALTQIPTQPQDAQDLMFRNLLSTFSITAARYENRELLDEALTYVPLRRVIAQVTGEYNKLSAIAELTGPNIEPEWGYSGAMIQALLRWFHQEFFTFVTEPSCTVCGSDTAADGTDMPTFEESEMGAARVEVYRCQSSTCGNYERFARYRDVRTLLRTRRGRAGEWTNCFTMLCRAVGARARWVWTAEGAVWTEVYSEQQRRWIHVDTCEQFWDRPQIYTEGWGRKLSYCIAFSKDGATDVTRRYVRQKKFLTERRKVSSESVLYSIILDIRRVRREHLGAAERMQLIEEDEREEEELAAYAKQGDVTGLSHSFSLVATQQGSDTRRRDRKGDLVDYEPSIIREDGATYHGSESVDYGNASANVWTTDMSIY